MSFQEKRKGYLDTDTERNQMEEEETLGSPGSLRQTASCLRASIWNEANLDWHPGFTTHELLDLEPKKKKKSFCNESAFLDGRKWTLADIFQKRNVLEDIGWSVGNSWNHCC